MNDMCDAIQNRLVKLHLTGIPIKDDPEVKAHLASCPTCRIYHDYLHHDHRALEVYAKSLDTYVDQVRHRLHRQIEQTQPDSPHQAGFPWWSAGAAIALIAGVIFLLNAGPDIPATQPRPGQGSSKVVTSKHKPTPEPVPAAVTQRVGQDINPDANGVKLEVVVTDRETGQPLAGAFVEVLPSQAPYPNGATNEQGLCRIGFKETSRDRADVRVGKAGYVPMFVSVTQLTKDASPYSIAFALETASVIGGIVQDPNGEPILGAHVDFYYEDRGVTTGPFTVFDFGTVTDAQGRWLCECMPAEIKQLDIVASHQNYARSVASAVIPNSPGLSEKALEALRQESFVITLNRGQSVRGLVTDRDGNPVPEATVVYESRDAIQTNESGSFSISRIPMDDTWMDVTVLAEGFPRTLRRISLPPASLPVEVVLHPGVTCHGRVVDANDRPLAHVAVTADLTGVSHPLLWQVQTDANGLYEISDLPSQRVQLSFKKSGYMSYSMSLRAEGPVPELALYPLMNVTGTVVDAEDAQPIESFRVIHGSYSRRHDNMQWHVDPSSIEIQQNGRVTSQFDEVKDGFALLIEAEGYDLCESRMLVPGEQNVTLDFALVKGDGKQGVVLDAQGKPVPKAQIFVATLNHPVTLRSGVPVDDHQACTRTDLQGQFRLKPKPDVQHVLAIDANGIGTVALADFMDSGTIVLEPWATVEGNLYIGTQPAAGHKLEAVQRDEDAFELGYYGAAECVTDEKGHFYFENVPPGRIRLYHHEYPIEPGQHLELHLGGKGRTVTGQFDLEGEQTVLWDSVLVSIVSLDDGPRDVNIKPSHRFRPDPRGRFRYDNLEPGHHAMVLSETPEGLYRPQRQLCRLWYDFYVPPISEEHQLNVPLELGTIGAISGDLEPGSQAPAFDLALNDGGRMTSQEHEGRLMLLSFYRLQELYNAPVSLSALRQIHNQYARDSRFVMMGMLSVDDEARQDQAPLDTGGLPWPHALLGETGKNRTHIEYDVLNTPWPWHVLVSPDGVVLAVGLQGDELVEAIETHLP